MQIIFTIIAIFGGLGLVAIGAVIGYLFGSRQNIHIKYAQPEVDAKHITDANDFLTDPVVPFKSGFYDKVRDLVGLDTTAISNEPSGIIYRPTSAELDKMNEDKATKEAKEAMAETLAQEEPPII